MSEIWKEIANQKDNGSFAFYGMKKYLSECSNISQHSESINYIVETYLECIDSMDFHTWLKYGNDDGKPMILTKKSLESEFKDLLQYSDDLETIRDLFMYLYGTEIWIDKEQQCLYTTMFNVSHNRVKFDIIRIISAYERLATLREYGIVSESDVENCVIMLKNNGYNIEQDYQYKNDNVDTMADNILTRLEQIFPSLNRYH